VVTRKTKVLEKKVRSGKAREKTKQLGRKGGGLVWYVKKRKIEDPGKNLRPSMLVRRVRRV